MQLPGGDWDFTPGIDVRETKKEIRVTVELPGVDKKDLDVRLDSNMLHYPWRETRGEDRERRNLDEQ